MTSYDLVVIGGGPGGYVAAIRAAQLGMRVACVEKRFTMGGTCLNVGCIPSKALLKSSEKYHEARTNFQAHGIALSGVSLDLPAMLARKDKIVRELTDGVAFLMKKNRIEWIRETARIAGPGRVGLSDGRQLQTRHTLIATGSVPAELPGIAVNERQIVSSTGALSLTRVPDRLVVIGGGYIGLELGSVWQRLGSKVTVVEFLDRIAPGMDMEVNRQFQRILKRQGIAFRLSTRVTGATGIAGGIRLELAPAGHAPADTGGPAGEPAVLDCETVLVATGRRPCTDDLGLDEAGVERDQRGFIRVDERFQTNVAGIYAVGDCIPGPMLAHKAEEEGAACAESLAGRPAHVNYDTIPGIIYTEPEVASVGKTEQQLQEEGVQYKTGKFPFLANARAKTNMATDGFVKILADAETDRILGAHIIGQEAGTLIHEIVLGMEFAAAAEDIARVCHGHPTLNETVREAALAVAGRALHM